MPEGIIQRWQPTCFRRFIKSLESSTKIVRIATDAGDAFVKPMSQYISPHKLACDLVGTQLAEWFGLAVFEYAVFDLRDDDEIPLITGKRAISGPVFATRAHRGIEWSGARRPLAQLDNLEDISRLVVFDTWTLNWDRFAPAEMKRRPRPDNIFLSAESATRGHFRVIAMDQSECFYEGSELHPRLANIQRIQDERLFGLFPVFVKKMNREIVRECAKKMSQIERKTIETFVGRIPPQWDVSGKIKNALVELILGRAKFLAKRIEDMLAPTCWPQGEFDFRKGSGS